MEELLFRVHIDNDGKNFTFMVTGINILDALDNFIEFMQRNQLPYREKTRSISIVPFEFEGIHVRQV